jgi:hypothetical protein
MTDQIIRTYSELIKYTTFEERFDYLKLSGSVGVATFGFDRYINQNFYKSQKWRSIREEVIIRDSCCDLGVEGHDIYKNIIIHHMNPISLDDICNVSDYLCNPEFLICTTLATHNAIHYGDESKIKNNKFIPRTKFDTCPWRR